MEIIIVGIANLIGSYISTIFHAIFIILLLISVKKHKLSQTSVVGIGLLLLMITTLSSLHQSTLFIATVAAQYMWICFAVSFVQQYTHYLKHEYPKS